MGCFPPLGSLHTKPMHAQTETHDMLPGNLVMLSRKYPMTVALKGLFRIQIFLKNTVNIVSNYFTVFNNKL